MTIGNVTKKIRTLINKKNPSSLDKKLLIGIFRRDYEIREKEPKKGIHETFKPHTEHDDKPIYYRMFKYFTLR
jgi:hypothetical protein